MKPGALLFLCALALGCAATHNKPSSAASGAHQSVVGVRGDVAATQSAVKSAQASTGRAGQISDSMAGHLDRAERKNVLVRRWFELNEGK